MNKIQCQSTVLLFLCMLSFFTAAQEDSMSCDAACHCIRNLTPAGVMVSHVHPKGEWMISYRNMQMNMGTPIHGNTPISSTEIFNNYLVHTPAMNMDMHMLMGMVGLSDRLTVMAMFHVVSNTMEMLSIESNLGHTNHSHSSHEMDMKTAGIGDTKLHLLYGLLKSPSKQVVLGLGMNVPTGSINQLGSSIDMIYPNKRLPYMMQLGSGTFDLSPSITYVKQNDKFAFSTQFSGTMRLRSNSVGYRLGNELNATTWLGFYLVRGFASSLRLEGSYASQISSSDPSIYAYNEIAANPLNYGGTRLQAFIGLSYEFEKGFARNTRISVEYGIPIYQDLNGIQNKLSSQGLIALSYNF